MNAYIELLIAELEAMCEDMGKLASELSDATAALRAIAPVYRAATRTPRRRFSDPSLFDAISTARARLTPELLAMIEAATK